MANLSIKKGDNVMVIAGKDKGRVGKVLKVNAKDNRIYVEGLNKVLKSKKPRNAQEQGGIIEREGTIDVSNVMLVCSSCGAVVRVKHEEKIVNGKKKFVRVCPKCSASLDETKASAKKATKAVSKAQKKTTKKKSEKTEQSADKQD